MKKSLLFFATLVSCVAILSSCEKDGAGSQYKIVLQINEILTTSVETTTLLPAGDRHIYVFVVKKKSGEQLPFNITASSSNADVCEWDAEKGYFLVKKAGESQLSISYEDNAGKVHTETTNAVVTETYFQVWNAGKKKSYSALPAMWETTVGYSFVFAVGQDDPSKSGSGVLAGCELYNVDFPIECVGTFDKPKRTEMWNFYIHAYNSPTWNVKGSYLLKVDNFPDTSIFSVSISRSEKTMEMLMMVDSDKGFAYIGKYAGTDKVIDY